MTRTVYDQGWLDGYNQFAKEQLARDERDNALTRATNNLQAVLDQSDRVRKLEALLRAWSDGWGTCDGQSSDLYHATLAALGGK